MWILLKFNKRNLKKKIDLSCIDDWYRIYRLNSYKAIVLQGHVVGQLTLTVEIQKIKCQPVQSIHKWKNKGINKRICIRILHYSCCHYETSYNVVYTKCADLFHCPSPPLNETRYYVLSLSLSIQNREWVSALVKQFAICNLLICRDISSLQTLG